MTADNRKVFVVGLGVALLVAAAVAQFASSSPDGLEYVAEQEGFADTAAGAESGQQTLTDTANETSDGSWLGSAIRGAAGVLATLAIGYGLFWLARKTNRDKPASA